MTENSNKLSKSVFAFLTIFLIISMLSFSSCMQPEKIKNKDEAKIVNFTSAFYANALNGYTGKAEESFFVISGSRKQAVEKLKRIIVDNETPENIFSKGESINFIIFRGVFRTGGYGISVDKLEKAGNEFLIYATYKNPEKGAMLIQVFTQPAMVISIGELDKGSYVARFFVRGHEKEDYKERGNVEFEVR